MKKKIAIWCCLAVVLAIFVYFSIDWSLRLKEFVDFYQEGLKEILLTYQDVKVSYIKHIVNIILSNIGIIVTIVITYNYIFHKNNNRKY